MFFELSVFYEMGWRKAATSLELSKWFVKYVLSSLFRSWIFKIHKKIVSLTELMAGVKAPSKTCQLFQLMCWPQGYKVHNNKIITTSRFT